VIFLRILPEDSDRKCRSTPPGAETCRDGEDAVDSKEYEALLVAIEQSIETSVSRGTEHFRGYRREPHPHGPGRLEKTGQKHDRLYNGSDVDSDDPYLDAIGRLHRDCCKRLKPEDN
jgi:hypothetical protein